MRAPILIPCALALGCVNANPTMYLLEPEDLRPRAERDEVIGVRELRLPDYAKDVRLVERRADGSLVHLEEHHWADRPNRSLARALVANLRQLTGTTVVNEPYPEGLRPELTLTVELDELDGTRGGEVRARGRYLVSTGSGVLRFFDFSLASPVEGETFADVTKAYAQTIAALAEHVYDNALR